MDGIGKAQVEATHYTSLRLWLAGWWPDRRAAIIDLTMGGLLLVLETVLSLLTDHNGGAARFIPVDWLFLVVGPLALLAWRRYPRVVLWVTCAAALAPASAGLSFLSLIVAFFLAATTGHRRSAWAAIISGYVGAMWVMPQVWSQHPPSGHDAAIVGGWLAFVVVAADALRMRNERVAERRRAERLEERRRTSESRLNMARDLHDVIGHTMSLINVQAAVGLDLIDSRPEQARAALTAIKSVSKDSLDELRAMLAALRQDAEEAPRSPTPGLDRLDELVDLTRAAGLPITLETQGDPTHLPTGVDVTAYRIVQEALTNVTRHAPGAAVRVLVAYQAHGVVVEITDSGCPQWSRSATPRWHGEGSGIGGMRERASALGGQLEAGPRAGGGFRVTARLPVGSGA